MGENPTKPKTRKRGCRAGCAGLFALLFLGFFVVPSTYRACAGWWQIRSTLQDAKSVTLVHYNPYAGLIAGTNIIYGSKELTPDEISRLSLKFPPVPDFGMPEDGYACIFDPHHKIVITDSAGRQAVIKICFLCDHIQIGEGNRPFVTPYAWRILLHAYFDKEGLPFEPDRYVPDYQESTKNVPVK